MEFGSLKYIGQVRLIPILNPAKQNNHNAIQQQGEDQQNNLDNGDESMLRQQQEQEQEGGDNGEYIYEYAKCGYGKLIWPDGSTFEGYWINGQACGVGIFRAPEPYFDVYEGFWQQDLQTNLCVFRQSANADIFGTKETENGAGGQKNQGEKGGENEESRSELTHADKQNGKGIEVWSDGSYYHGEFREGVKEGEGVYFWADGSKYTGAWQNDEMSGQGTFQWADGRYFEGKFQNGVMHGHGNYVWQDGRKYEGSYRFNKKHGQGTYTYSDGSKYRGEWVDGKQHGVGCIIDADSTYERKGLWQQGNLKQWFN